MYGWISREQDSYKDFVVVKLECLEGSTTVKVGDSVTSSEEYTEEINEILYGTDVEHNSCKRVEQHFDVENSVELGGEQSS